MQAQDLIECSCPYCNTGAHTSWASENGFTTVRCDACNFLYLSPRPDLKSRDKATELGVHGAADDMNIAERYVPAKVQIYRKIFAREFADVWFAADPIVWLDIGAGYGEVMDAIKLLAPKGSKVIGLEPMKVKSEAAKKRGLSVLQSFIGPETPRAQYISLINVFSHVYDFDALLRDIHSVLLPNGELFVETGDATDLINRDDFPGELGSPDHVAFASLKHLEGFLQRNGFQIIKARRDRIDGTIFTIKNIAKKLLGRNVRVMWPHTSPYRTLFVRARKLD